MPVIPHRCVNDQCKEFEKIKDVLKGINDESTEVCGVCNQPMRRSIGGGVGAKFNGTGFHCTDYN